jgi:hypothetical protein
LGEGRLGLEGSRPAGPRFVAFAGGFENAAQIEKGFRHFGLPLEGVAGILGVDALRDMARTSINLVGNCLATVVMARWEGAFDLSAEDTPVADALEGQALSVPAVLTPRDDG